MSTSSLLQGAGSGSTAGGLSTGAKIGIAVGVVVSVAIAAACVMHYFGRRARIANARKNAIDAQMRLRNF